MSLTSALSAATSALMTTQYQLAVSTGNVANAGVAGATEKTYVSSSPVSLGMTLGKGEVTRITDAYLSKTLNTSSAANGKAAVVGSYLSNYDTALGSVAAGDDLSSLLTGFQTALSSLATTPTSSSARSDTVAAASSLAEGISGLSSTLQSMRSQADSDVANTVAAVNTSLQTLKSLNDQIRAATNTGADATGLEDQRDTELTNLSSMIGVSYYTSGDNQLAIYDQAGDQLLGSQAATLDFTGAGQLDASATYPGVIGGVTLNGKDITGALQTGKLGGLIQLRDQSLPAEQDKLDQMAATLISQVNTASNAGTAFPPPNTLTSATTVSAGDSFSASGTVRVAVTSAAGTVVSTTDLNLASYSTVGALLTGLNAIGGLNASISPDGKLALTASAASNGVAINGLSSSVGAGGQAFSDYFGFNNLFSGDDAASIAVSPDLAASAAGLPTATLSAASGLAAGASGVSSSDTSAVTAIGTALSTGAAFTAVGTAAAQTSSLQAYASSFVADAATLISDATDAAGSSQSNVDFVKNALSNETGINVDQETALITQYQNQYEAAAQLMVAVKDMFSTLISAMQAA